MNSQSTKPRHKISKRETGILRRLFQLNNAIYQKSSNDGKNKIQEENKNTTLPIIMLQKITFLLLKNLKKLKKKF